MKTTRQLILDYLERNHITSAAEISHTLDMTPANARHHLSTLLDQGVVQVVGQQPMRRRGRPTLLYALTAQASQHNLDQLSSALLAEILSYVPPEIRQDALKQIAVRLQGEEPSKTASLTQRLYQAVNRLNQMRYQSRWEARAEAPRLILGHCPYAMILPDNPELCLMDAYIIESLLGTSVLQVEKLAKDQRGALFCMFTVQKT